MMNETKSPICIGFQLNRTTKGNRDLESGNEMISANDRLHFHLKAEITKHLRELANIEARQYVGDLTPETCIFTKENPCHIFVHICPPSSRRMDAPNWYPTVKALVDGLTDAHIFKDDNDNVITSFTFIRGPQTTNKKYQIVLEIRYGRLT